MDLKGEQWNTSCASWHTCGPSPGLGLPTATSISDLTENLANISVSVDSQTGAFEAKYWPVARSQACWFHLIKTLGDSSEGYLSSVRLPEWGDKLLPQRLLSPLGPLVELDCFR